MACPVCVSHVPTMRFLTDPLIVMFRIVEDDMPPLPECASPMLEDFLKQCFNKDPTLRPSAELLCEHEWLKKSWSGLKVGRSFRHVAPVAHRGGTGSTTPG